MASSHDAGSSQQQNHSSGELDSQLNNSNNTAERVLGHWTDEEHDRFVEAIMIYGKDWSMIE
jgi:hypothetical protein